MQYTFKKMIYGININEKYISLPRFHSRRRKKNSMLSLKYLRALKTFYQFFFESMYERMLRNLGKVL